MLLMGNCSHGVCFPEEETWVPVLVIWGFRGPSWK